MSKLLMFAGMFVCVVAGLAVTNTRADAQGWPAEQVTYGDPAGSGSLVSDSNFLRPGADGGVVIDNITITTAGTDEILCTGEGFTLNAQGNALLESTSTAGTMTVKSGTGNASTNGGQLELQAGNGTSTSTGGLLILKAGGGGTTAGAVLSLAGSKNGVPANTTLTAAAGGTGGGELQLSGGGVPSGSGANGGSVLIQAGASSNTGVAGNTTLLGGTGVTNGIPGAVLVQGGGIGYLLSSNNGGSATVAGGNTSGTGAGGNVVLAPGQGSGVGGTPYGNLQILNATTSLASPGAGAAGVLPATPAGYITVYINSVAQQIPYY